MDSGYDFTKNHLEEIMAALERQMTRISAETKKEQFQKSEKMVAEGTSRVGYMRRKGLKQAQLANEPLRLNFNLSMLFAGHVHNSCSHFEEILVGCRRQRIWKKSFSTTGLT